jgi:hypothetical protein
MMMRMDNGACSGLIARALYLACMHACMPMAHCTIIIYSFRFI